MIQLIGWGIGLIEIMLYFLISFIGKRLPMFRDMSSATYYWLCMTMLTGLWEASYLVNYDEVEEMAVGLCHNNTHAWTNWYSLDYILPWNLAKIFYAEYGAWADREYMSFTDDWSHTIEGTHAIFCAGFAFLGMFTRFCRNDLNSLLLISMAMAFQLMNSILYMVEYGIQCSLSSSVNYNSTAFPLGHLMIKRPFMYVNIFWLIMPTYILFYEMIYQNLNDLKKQNNNNKYSNSSSGSITPNENPTKKMFESSIESPPEYYSINKKKVTDTGTELGTKEETEKLIKNEEPAEPLETNM